MDSPFRKPSKLRQYALPASIELHKEIRRPLLRAEGLSHEFTLRAGQGRDNRAISIDTNTNIVGLHHLVG